MWYPLELQDPLPASATRIIRGSNTRRIDSRGDYVVPSSVTGPSPRLCNKNHKREQDTVNRSKRRLCGTHYSSRTLSLPLQQES